VIKQELIGKSNAVKLQLELIGSVPFDVISNAGVHLLVEPLQRTCGRTLWKLRWRLQRRLRHGW